MPAEFINVPEETDPDIIAQDIYEYLESKVSTWTPDDAELDTWMINAVARILAVLKDMASEARIAIFRVLGATIFQLPPIEASKAYVTSKWVLTDTLGHTIEAGTPVGIPDSSGTLQAFEVTEDIIVPVGSKETAADAVPLQAVEAGSIANGIGKAGTVATLEGQLPWVATGGITLSGETGGGADEEEDQAYLNRLVTEIRLWAQRPITPQNFADMALNIAGVGRALALNLYNPETKTFGNEKTLTLALEDGLGNAAATPVKEAVRKYLAEKREVNFVIFVIDPSFNSIDVEWEANHWEGFESAAVKELGNKAIEEFLQPQTWGLPPFGDKKVWYSRPEVKINDIIQALGRVEGLKDVLSVKIRPHATGAYEVKDIVLTGAAALTQPGTITGTVV